MATRWRAWHVALNTQAPGARASEVAIVLFAFDRSLAPFLENVYEKFHLCPPAVDYFPSPQMARACSFSRLATRSYRRSVSATRSPVTTSGYLMGFGLGDFDSCQKQKLLEPVDAESSL